MEGSTGCFQDITTGDDKAHIRAPKWTLDRMALVCCDVKDVEKPYHFKDSPLPQVAIYRSLKFLYGYFILTFAVNKK